MKYIKKISLSILLSASSLSWGVDEPKDSIVHDNNSSMPYYSIGYVSKMYAAQFAKKNEGKQSSVDPVIDQGFFKKYLSGLTVGGYYRGYFYSRTMPTPYGGPGGLGANKYMGVWDSYYDPQLFMYLGGNPTPTTSFGTEVIMRTPFDQSGVSGNIFNVFQTMVMRGSANTKIGNFYGVVGGIEWRTLTPFTFGSNIGYQRYSLFERRPWDPVGNIKTRYASYYYTGAISQDIRFGTQAFKGIMIQGNNMPWNTSTELFVGRTQFNQGFLQADVVRPSQAFGGKINKMFKKDNRVSLNTFNTSSRTDSINAKTSDINIYTTEYVLNVKDIQIIGETGIGGYSSPSYKRAWGGAFITEVRTPKKYTLLPFSFRYHYIDKKFMNNVANFQNASLSEIYTGYIGSGIQNITPLGTGMTGVGGLSNNRQGFGINTSAKVWKIRMTAGTEMFRELALLPNSSTVTYSHNINGLAWSRLPLLFPFPGQMGPNARVGTFYRGAYETVNISDTTANNTPASLRGFNGLDIQLKYKDRLFRKDIYINYLGTFNSVQGKLSPITVFDNSAYIRTYYHEAELYYQLHRDFVIDFYYGYERVIGNDKTDISATSGKARNQYGNSYGIGFDWSLSSKTALFFRQRWFDFEDKNFENEKFKGREATVELKIFF